MSFTLGNRKTKFLEKDDLQELGEKIRTMAPHPDGLDKFHALFDELEK